MPSTAGIVSGAGSLKNPQEPIALGYRVNLIKNPAFENGSEGWSAIGGATLSRVTTQAHTGTTSLRVVNSSTSSAQYGTTGTGNMTPLIGGVSQYTVSAYVKADASTGSATYFIRHLQYENETGGSTTATGNVGLQVITSADGWVRLTGTFTKVASSNFVVIRVATQSTTSGDIFYVDSVMLEPRSSASTYFDGSTGGYWLGTPHLSISADTPYF